MNNSSCRDTVFSALKGAYSTDGSPLKVNDDTVNRLEKACKYLDGFLEDTDHSLVRVVVLDNCLYISIDCKCFFDVNAKFKENLDFPRLIARFNKVSFSQIKSDNVRVTLKMNLV